MSQAQDPATPADAPVGQELERLVASARDALTDDMVMRLSATLGDGLDLLDRVNRSGVAEALPTIAAMARNGELQRLANSPSSRGREEVQRNISDFVAEAACAAREQAEKTPPGRGGIGGLWQIAKDPATQDALRFLALVKANLKGRSAPAPLPPLPAARYPQGARRTGFLRCALSLQCHGMPR